MSRTQGRQTMDVATRLYLLEGDADEFEEAIAKVGMTLNKILWVLVGLLISVSTGALLLALNLVVVR